MKKLIYLIIAITVLGLIVAGCIPVVPPVEQDEPSSLTKGGTTWTVGPSGLPTYDYTTIQAAIDAATTLDGDTIDVAAGTYYENVVVNKSLSLLTNPGAVLNGSGAGNGFLIQAANITISGFEITNFQIGIRSYGGLSSNFGNLTISNVNNHNNLVNGVLIVHDTFNTVTFENCQINSNNQNGIGIANAAQISSLQLINTTISNNGVSIAYSGLYIATSGTTLSSLTASNLIMAGNKGCGILIDSNSSVSNASFSNTNITGSDVNFSVRSAQVNGLVFQNCQLSNSPTNHGLWIRGGTVNNLEAYDTSFSYNKYQGFFVSQSGVLNNAIISGGLVEGNEFGVFTEASTVTNLTVTGVTINNLGSGLSVVSGTVNGLTVENCTFQYNAWEHLDIGLWSRGLNISNVNITGNTFAAGPWCSIYVDSTAIFGANDIEIHLNNFVIGQWGVYSVNNVSVDATCNWWGAADGPSGFGSGSGGAVSANVVFDPWTGITITGLSGPIDPVQIGESVGVDYSFTCGPSSATLAWGDENSTNLTVNSGTNSGTEYHSYSAAGVYTVTLTIENSCSSESREFQYVVVYDPTGGFVTGGGWIYSPAGAYNGTDLEGKATFGFVSKYKKGQTTPTGNTEFKFKAGDLNFQSESYDWLVIAGHKAMYKGTGTINGSGEYGFMLSAIDEELTPSTDVDLFRIKIWDKSTDTVIYDNQVGDEDDADLTTAIGGGQIVIHKAK